MATLLAVRRPLIALQSPFADARLSFKTGILGTNANRSVQSIAQSESSKPYDVFIVGGGVAGSTLAKLLKDQARIPLRIGILDAAEEPPPLSSFPSSNTDTSYPMARSYAMSPSSLYLLGLQEGGVVDRIRQLGRVSEYDKMQVWESNGPGNLRFSSKDLATHPDRRISSQGVLGSMLEDSLIVSALWDELRDSTQDTGINEGKLLRHSIEFFSSCSITSIESSPASTAEGATRKETGVVVTFQRKESESQEIVRTNLLIGADGGNSFVRKSLGIPTMGFEYGRTAVTTTVKLQDITKSKRRNNTMQRTAFQRFFASGPVALLPMWDKGEYANVVWSTTPEHAAELVSMSTEDFVRQLNEALQKGPANSAPFLKEEYSSKLPHIVQNIAYGVDMVARTVGEGLAMARWNVDPFQIPPSVDTIVCHGGKRFAFPLSLSQARSYVKPNVALVGDAAHTIHPMAGQGLNLGLGDVACLAQHIVNAQKCGMHAGDTSYFLDLYESDRQRAAMTMMGAIQFLHAAFGTEVSPVAWARSMGVNIANCVTPLREKLAHAAAGDLENHSTS